jgi:hypothetical protein
MFKLVKNNVEALYQDIPTECLCKTFTDALEVIRTIGIGYLWIDSLCIVQDDDEDVKAPGPLLPPTLKIPSKIFLLVPRHLLYQSL